MLDVQVRCSLLELCGRHMVMFHVKVPQISLIRQLVYNSTESFTVRISAPNRDFFWSLTRVSWHILLQCGRWVLPDWRSFSSTYLCRNFASFNSLMRFFHPFFSWCRLHQKFIIFVFRDGNTVWKNKWFIIFIFVQFSCESWIRWFSLWWDSSNPTQYVPSWNSWLENSTSQKLDK